MPKADQRQAEGEGHGEFAGETEVVVTRIDIVRVHDGQPPGARSIMLVQFSVTDETMLDDKLGIKPFPVAVELTAIKVDLHAASELTTDFLQGLDQAGKGGLGNDDPGIADADDVLRRGWRRVAQAGNGLGLNRASKEIGAGNARAQPHLLGHGRADDRTTGRVPVEVIHHVREAVGSWETQSLAPG